MLPRWGEGAGELRGERQAMSATDVQQDGAGTNGVSAQPAARDWRRPWLALPPRVRVILARIGDRYPELPPLRGIGARAGLAVVSALSLAYVVFFTLYLWAQQDAYQTHAEDLGIMDQALWNTGHGAVLHQTICNIVGDSNCLGDVSRLGIHFEPIMFPIALLYLLAPSPKTLQLLQALVVASGAFPAYWIAGRRLRSAFAGVVFAAVYLLYPALQAAVTYDFHAVTLSAAFLMFVLYFMLTRNDRWLIVCCVLALATKESIVVDVALIGLSIAVLQRRPRLGLGLVGLSVCWLAIELAVMHAASPIGHSPTAGRYAYLGSGPVQAALYILIHPLNVIRGHMLDPNGTLYLRSLLSPVAYLPLLSPLTLVIAVPALGINLLSSDPAMRSGLYQYNADIVPVLVLAAIESVALLAAVSGWVAVNAGAEARRTVTAALDALGSVGARLRAVPLARVVMLALTLLVLLFGLREQQARGYTPLAHAFAWPQQTAHTRLANDLLARIPPAASVSAQSDLVPHISERRFIYLYPYMAQQSEYVLLDVTGNFYPFKGPSDYFESVRQLVSSGTLHVAAAEDGYLLLARGAAPPANPADPYGLPAAFYNFAELGVGQAVPHPVAARFGPSLELVGYDVVPSSGLSVQSSSYMTVTTYWRVAAPLSGSYAPQLTLLSPNGTMHTFNDFATAQWLPPVRWEPGQTLVLRTWPIFVTDVGRLRLGVRVYGPAAPVGNGAPAPLPALLLTSAGLGGSAPTLLDGGTLAIFADVQAR
jgi:uncharacterized membrane protein